MRIVNCARPLPATVSANVTTAQIFPNGTSALALTVPGSGRHEQRQFIVRASGYIVTAANTNVTVTLYKGTSLTVASNTVIKASTATAQDGSSAAVTSPFWLEGRFVCESVVGAGHGTVKFMINNTLVAEAAITALASLNMATEPALSLCVGVTFSAANVGNKAVLNEFCMGY